VVKVYIHSNHSHVILLSSSTLGWWVSQSGITLDVAFALHNIQLYTYQ
jgi:hypothetical protein